ncbi:hypothetical protein OGAPHI_004566 [Ogataea philodendri]|uniref:Sodium/calcium exchanger membrane region domain-containing protein n=1 Tax=Ogataea philodendri TaxID=1378263 RepID=A0A9P8P2V7_9ASCO|nr:uncharacterized protein OGAPHI_004566 [Ogataea philodendri]KAH3664215.1 hypothetical protein OGAPHI_004566 [Ogataea philodendri]
MSFDGWSNSPFLCPVPLNDPSTICQFIRDNCDRDNFKYLELYYCSGMDAVVPGWLLALVFLALIGMLFFVLGFLASNSLTPNLTYLASLLNLGEKLAGVTLLAFANGSPDILSTWVAMNSGSTGLAIGELLGSANFALTVVIGTMAIVRPFTVDYASFVKDVTLFLVLIVLSLLFLFDGKIKLYESVAMCLLYVIYIAVNFFSPEKLLAETHPKLHDGTSAETQSTAVDAFDQNIESLESGRSFRLSLADSIKLAFRTCDLNHLKNYYRADDSEFQHSPDRQRSPEIQVPQVPAQIVITPAEDDEFVPQEPQSDGMLTPPDLSRSSSVSSNASISTILSAEPVPVTWKSKLVPNYGRLVSRNKPFESIYNIATLPLACLVNVAVPTPANSPKELALNVRLFHFQLVLAPMVLLHQVSVRTVEIAAVLELLNVLVLSTWNSLYVRIFPAVSSIAGFLGGLNLITAVAAEIVALLKNIGVIYRVNESLLGLTILSIGNSIGDLITNSTLSSLGLALTGLHACFGSPLLYILLGVGLNSLIVNLRTGESVEFQVDAHLKLSSFSLITILLLYIVVVPLRNWKVDKLVGYLAVLFWVAVTMLNIYFIN